MKHPFLFGASLIATIAACAADTFEELKRQAVDRERLIIWDDDGCDMTHYPYQRADLARQPASARNFERENRRDSSSEPMAWSLRWMIATSGTTTTKRNSVSGHEM